MPRTTETSVREIIATSLTTPQVNAFIADANLWVTEELGAEGYSAERMELIERYLACAFIRVRDLGITNSDVKGVKEAYQVDPNVTEYLQHAAAFDSSGILRQTFIPTETGGWTIIAQTGKGYGEEADGG